MDTISHRELRNSSSLILKAVAAGESYIVTNHGEPIARIVPFDSRRTELRCIKPATRHGFEDLPTYDFPESTQETLDYLREDRV